ncbi:MAG TPA: Nex18 symbiotically induced protein [Proteiniclasticum sp.]|nr:Nex18 symbiotically induced protein [Proteiniclasticum sp.]
MLKKVSMLVAVMMMVFSIPVFATAPTDDIVDIAVGNPDFSILVAALQKAELVETLQGEGPFTVFAPTNAAFEKLLEALDISAEELLAQPDLAKVLTYHVVAGKVMSTDLTDGMKAATVNGEEITVDLSSGVKINDSTVTSADIEASNGVIHVIDTVLVPSNFTLQEVDMEETEAPQTGLPVAIPFFFTAALTAGGALVLFKKKEA